MIMKRPPQLSFSNVISCLALFVALGGTSYAVARNSVGEKQLKNNAVTSSKVRDGSLTASDFGGISAPRGPRGADGPAGPPGGRGEAGPQGAPGPAAAEPWKALAFSSGWTNFGAIFEVGSYRKDQLGVVHLRGLITRAAGTPGGGSQIAVLPPGYHPQRALIFVVQTGEPNGVGRIDVRPDGSLTWNSGQSGEQDYTSLTGISFSTD
jgi:hypothetical protein